MKKYMFVAVFVAILFLLAISSYGITGLFTKAFDKSLSPGEKYERNITVRMYYNLSIRFQKEGSSSYLGFTDNESIVVLKDVNGNEIFNSQGVRKGRIYTLVNSSLLNSIATASAYSISNYEDVIDQPVNVTYSGTKAYVTITVKYRAASISGYVFDDLTGQSLEGIEIYAFDDGADPSAAIPVVQNTSASDGKYSLSLQLNASKALDVYVKDFDVA